jgi:hypothetical protein
MGVSMLLAMVISTMAGVIVLMQPFMEDLNDNRDWSAASVAANQFSDRLNVAAEAPEGSGIVTKSQHLADTIRPLRLAEIWSVSADLAGSDRVIVTLGSNAVNVTSVNGTATDVTITTSMGQNNGTLDDGQGEIVIGLDLSNWIIIDVHDTNGIVIHRWIQVPLDGIQLRTPLNEGTFQIDLVNGARIEQLPNKPIDVRVYPRLNHDQTLDGQYRVSLVLLNTQMSGLTDHSIGMSLELISGGVVSFFDGDARNLRIVTDFAAIDGRESRYLHEWTDDYDIHRAIGELDDYNGFGPYGRVSGVEGMTLHPTNAIIHLDVIMQQVIIQ